MTYPDLIQLIQTERKRQNLTQSEMADLLHMNLVAYKRMEQMQTKLDVVRLIDIVKVLKISITIE
jgi:transcriptional regulator with XRE-family HTH domain